MQIPRYVTGAFLFGLIYVVIQYTQGHITNYQVLIVHFLLFGVLGSALSWALTTALNWYKNRK